MARHPLHEVAIAGLFNTLQARRILHTDAVGLMLEATRGALADAGLRPGDVDGFSIHATGGECGLTAAEAAYLMGARPSWTGTRRGIEAILDAAAAIACGVCHTALIGGAQVGSYQDRAATAPWTRPNNEFVACWGLYTAAEFALIARRHMHLYGTQPDHLAEVAATIRNHGHRNPEAVYYGKGPFTREEILNSRIVADPFRLLDCAMTCEGGGALILTTAERARDLPNPPAYILGGALETLGQFYTMPPRWDLSGAVGAAAARTCFEQAGGLGPEDVDVCVFYDPFSFEIIRQFEAFGFCGPGEGGPFVMDGRIALDGEYPIVPDGGIMAFSHSAGAQGIQRVMEAAWQVRGDAVNQVPGARIAMATNGGAGALFTHVVVLGKERPG
jgi:acetyl-CoA acetyltransferase